MDVTWANPAGLWALAGIPAVLLLHLLQRKNRKALASTLFLLDHLQEDTRKGAVITRLRNGWQLWLQLLAVLLLTLLLAQPRTLKEKSVQQVALVLDVSSSMQAFRAERAQAVEEIADRFAGVAGEIRWWVLPSDDSLPRIAAAADRETLLSSVNDTTSTSGPHDPSPRLREARSLVGPDGVVLYLTDHLSPAVSSGAEVVSVGRPLPNMSLSGLQFETSPDADLTWQVSVVNRSDAPLTREVQMNSGAENVYRASITVPAGGIRTVEGVLPADVKRGVLSLEPADAFSRDDAIPFVRPVPKQMIVFFELDSGPHQKWAERIAMMIPGVDKGQQGDVVVGFADESSSSQEVAGKLLFTRGKQVAPYQRILPAEHPLPAQLEWDSLLAQPFDSFELRPTDTVLLQMGEEPLVVLRRNAGGRSLILNFDPGAGNGFRHAGLALLTYRFFSSVQEGLDAVEWSNQLTGQQFRLPEARVTFEPLNGETEEGLEPAGRLPDQPGWLTGTREEDLRMMIAVSHGDVEEGDFRTADSKDLSEDLILKQRKRHEESDLLLPLWMCLLSLTVMGTWWAGAERGRAG